MFIYVYTLDVIFINILNIIIMSAVVDNIYLTINFMKNKINIFFLVLLRKYQNITFGEIYKFLLFLSVYTIRYNTTRIF